MHSPDGQDEPHAQMARARTRTSVPPWRRGAHPQSTTTTQSVRSALEVARQRWASSTPQAPDDTPEELDDTPETAPTAPLDHEHAPAPASAPPSAPAPGSEPAPGLGPRPRRSAPRTPAPEHPMPYSSWKGYSRPLRDTWRTYCDGAGRVMESSPILVAPYWAVGVPILLVHCTARLVQDSTTSVTRGVVLVVVVTILIVGIAIALS